MSKLIDMVFGEGRLELSYNRGVGFGLAERKGVGLNRCNKVGEQSEWWWRMKTLG